MQRNANHVRSLLWALLLPAVLFTAAEGRVICVDGDAVAEPDGSGWTSAYRTLQDAITVAWFGDEVRVAHGTYTPDRKTSSTGRVPGTIWESGSRTATFNLLYNVTFKGGYAGYGEPDPNVRDVEKYETILSGDLEANDIDVSDPGELLTEPSRAENSLHVVTVAGTAVLDGFTIAGGSADDGGGLLNRYGMPQIINCTFRRNSAQSRGGAMYNGNAHPTLVNCTFTGNFAGSSGGAICNYDECTSDLTNCTFSGNRAWYAGGAVHSYDCDANLVSCTFIENSSRYGGAMYNERSRVVLANCEFRGNHGFDYGGGAYNAHECELFLKNCAFVANQAGMYGAGMSSNRSDLALANCTFVGNSASQGEALAFNGGRSTAELSSSILWGNHRVIWIADSSAVDISYSNVFGGWPGGGNIDADPMFVSAGSPDLTLAAGDYDLRLAPLSPCVNTGDPHYAPGPDETDLDGNKRIVAGRIDMGAYEFQSVIYVDDDAPCDPAPCDPNISALGEDGSESRPFDTIQEAIDVAGEGDTVLVRAGLYSKIDYKGKAITVAGADGAAVLETPEASATGLPMQDAVTFHTGEGPASVLRNLIIRNSGMAISLNYGSSPTISNITIVQNDFGIAAYENSAPDISNCIFWNNRDGDLFQCQARYSCIESGAPGRGNITVNPVFVDEANGDYHLLSEGWYWCTFGRSWTYHDSLTSRCIDMGDPASPLRDEPLVVPRDIDNEYGVNRRINMGAFGGTSQASMPPNGWVRPEYDTAAPEPNPAQWAPDGTPRRILSGSPTHDNWIVMTAAEATDDSGWVEYLFTCTSDPDASSQWQKSPYYAVPVGNSWRHQEFRVKVRDQYGNETQWSEPGYAQ